MPPTSPALRRLVLGAMAVAPAVVVVALAFDYTNGFHDAANAIATSISTRALTPRVALVMAAIIMTAMIYKRVDLTIVLNGAIGGLVSITAEPLTPAIWQAILIGAMGGVIVTVGVPILDRLKIDDVVGAIPAHLFCGIWGTLIAAWTNADASIGGQIVGVFMVGVFTFGMSALLWVMLKYSIGARVTAEQEILGLDRAELGLEAYPEFAGR